MKMTKFKTLAHSDSQTFDNDISCHLNNKWTLHGDPRTTVTPDGSVTHFQSVKKEFDLSTDEAKQLFYEASERAGEL